MSDENTNDSKGVKDLREQFEALSKQNKELADQLSAYKTAERKQTVAAALKAKGLPEKVANLYNGEDFSEEAVSKWADEYKDVFGAPAQTPPGAQAGVTTPGQEALFAQMMRVQEQSTGSAPVVSTPPGTPIMGDPVEMERFMRTAPYEQLQELGWQPKTGTLFNPQRG